MLRKRNKCFVIVSCLITVLCLAYFIPINQISDTVQSENPMDVELEPQNDTKFEGIPMFQTSAEGDDYVDAVETVNFGNHTSPPPSGMGEDSESFTVLTEGMYNHTTWTNVLTHDSFTSLPTGWSDNNIHYFFEIPFVAPFPFGPTGTGASYIHCSPVSTMGYDQVRFSLILVCYSSEVYVDFYNSSSSWNQQGSFPSTGPVFTQISFSSTDSQYLHENFSVRIRTDSASDMYVAHSWKIDGGMDYTHARIDTTYKFTGVDFANFTFNDLIVEFGEDTSSEVLDFRFDSGDSTPDSVVAVNKSSTFSVDIQPYLTGPECYVSIRDVFDLTDNQTDYWKISRMYIRHTNSEPQNDQTPTCVNLDDGNNLYARHKLYEFTTSVVDYNGVSQIEFVELRSYDSSMTELRWAVRFDEDNKTFTEEAGASFIELVGSEYVNNSQYIYITFRMYIEWDHPNSTGDCLQQYVEDSFGASDEDTYFVNYDYETRLDIIGLSLNDGNGVNNWGDVNGEFTASGTLIYFGSSNIVTSEDFDVWVSAPLTSGAGPWSGETDESGYFTIIVEADDTPGIDIYSFDVVLIGTGQEGESHLHSIIQSTYICTTGNGSIISGGYDIVHLSIVGVVGFAAGAILVFGVSVVRKKKL